MLNQKMTERMFGAIALLGAVLIWSAGALAQPPKGIQGNVIVENDVNNPVPVVIQGVDGDVAPTALQVELVARFEDGLWGATSSERLSVESGKTAVFEYISCNMSYGPAGLSESSVELYVNTINPDGSAGRRISPYQAALVLIPNYNPAPFQYGHASSLVSACIGEKCTGLDGTQYPSLSIIATRNVLTNGIPGQEMRCTIFGSVY